MWAVPCAAAGVDGAEHPAGDVLDQAHGRAAGRADVGEVAGAPAVGPEPAAWTPAQQAALGERVDGRPRTGPEHGQVLHGERRLGSGGAQVRAQDVGVVGVEDVGLDRLPEQGLGVVDQIGVQRVVARHHHPERVAGAAPGPADLLPQGRAGAGEAGEQHGVEAADVDAELERVGRGQAEQPAVAQRLLERAALLGEVAAAVGRHLVDQARVDLAEQASRGQGDRLGAAAGADEGERADAVRRPGRSAGRRPRWWPSGGRARRSHPARARTAAPTARAPCGRAGEPSSVTATTSRPVSRPADDLRLRDGGRGQHEGGVGAVQRRDPAQPAQDLGHVGAEDPAVVVALVDHDVAQRSRRTATTARGRAAASGAACRGWSGRTPPWSRVHSRISGVESPSWVEAPQVGQPRLRRADAAWRAGPGRAPWWGRGRARRRRAAPSAAGRSRSRAARGAGRPATCPRPCRSRSPCGGPGGRGRRLRPGASTAWVRRAARTTRAPARAATPATSVSRAGRGLDDLEVGQAVGAAGTTGQAAPPAFRDPPPAPDQSLSGH